jgi:hypothetical protein
MSSPTVWGPSMWIFLHTLAEKINDKEYKKLVPTLYSYIKRMCTVLPCGECSRHATLYLNNVPISKLRNKMDFRKMFFNFHNMVNYRKSKQMFNINDLDKYKKNNILVVFNSFVKTYNVKPFGRPTIQSVERQKLVAGMTKFLNDNIKHF